MVKVALIFTNVALSAIEAEWQILYMLYSLESMCPMLVWYLLTRTIKRVPLWLGYSEAEVN